MKSYCSSVLVSEIGSVRGKLCGWQMIYWSFFVQIQDCRHLLLLNASFTWVNHSFFFRKGKICETQPPASIGWVALSSVVCRLFVPHQWHLLSSPLYDVSEHTNHIFSVSIWSRQHVSVNISSVAELSPVYCCLVFHNHRLPQQRIFWKIDFEDFEGAHPVVS